ncbi:hypothetical protein FRX31_013408 [Thalictrum thalictroides]|uniref:Uncharacterized protein n=1 Tax=Thalictrum thalictroides TaxID=46969 RepID=A0A7J6WHZ6_THATH|nr:hypothetical protein FRX31_013408 [Thalictrum thalictroides]
MWELKEKILEGRMLFAVGLGGIEKYLGLQVPCLSMFRMQWSHALKFVSYLQMPIYMLSSNAHIHVIFKCMGIFMLMGQEFESIGLNVLMKRV